MKRPIAGAAATAVLCSLLVLFPATAGRAAIRCSTTVQAGGDIQAALDAQPEKAVICVAQGIFTLGAQLVPKARQAYVRAILRRAYRAASAAAARRQLTALATWLERNGHADAAASVREGLEETLTGGDLSPSCA